jgi:hypothetical protein
MRPAADLADPPGQERAQPGLQRPALTDRPGRDQVSNVFQAHPDHDGFDPPGRPRPGGDVENKGEGCRRPRIRAAD